MDYPETLRRADNAVVRAVESRRLLYGPYTVPQAKLGEELPCSIHGLQVVSGWHGPMQWPKAKARGRPKLIVCCDLLRAVRQETCDTVALHWGVHRRTVANWRRGLGCATGATRARSSYTSAKMRVLRSDTPERFVEPGERHLAAYTYQTRRRLGERSAGARVWSAEEIGMLGSMSGKELSKLLGRPIRSVASARARYGISAPSSDFTCAACGYSWRSYLADAPSRCANCGRRRDNT